MSNYRNNQGSAQKKSSYGGLLGSPHSTGHAATQDLVDLLNSCLGMLTNSNDFALQSQLDPNPSTPRKEVSIDQLYKLLDETTKQVLILLTTHDTERGEQGLRLDTSLISIYLNRCHLSFKQMMFENLAQLKEALSLFI